MLGRLTDADGVPAGLHPAFLRACVRQNLLEQPSPDSTASAIVHDLTAGLIDRQGRRSLGFNIEQTVRVAGAVRDRLSTDNWRVLNRLLQLFTRESHALDLDDALELIDDALFSLVGGRRARDGPHDAATTAGGFSASGVTSSGCISSPARSATSRRIRRRPDRACSNGCSSCRTAC